MTLTRCMPLYAICFTLFTAMCLAMPTHAEPVDNRGEVWLKLTATQAVDDKSALVYSFIAPNDFTAGNANVFRYNEIYYERTVKKGLRWKLGVAHLSADAGNGVEEWHIFPGYITNHATPNKRFSLYTWGRLANIHRVGESGDSVQVHMRVNPRIHLGDKRQWMLENRLEWFGHLNDREWGRRRGTFQLRYFPNFTYTFNDVVAVRAGYQMSYFPNNNSSNSPEIRHALRAELFLTNPHTIAYHAKLKKGALPRRLPDFQWHSGKPADSTPTIQAQRAPPSPHWRSP